MGGGGGTVGGFPDPFITIPRTPTTTTPNSNSQSHRPSSSSSSSHVNLSCPANYTSLGTERCKNKLETLDGTGNIGARSSYYDNVFAPVPSRIEVENAISDLRRLMLALSTCNSELERHQQMLYPYDPSMLQSLECRRIIDALHMLQSDSPVQKIVVSISSDKAVWDAILNNKEVQDLCGSLCTAKEERTQSSSEELDLVNLILKWIFGITKAKIIGLIETLNSLVNEIFHPVEKGKPTLELSDLLEEKVRPSLFLSIVILLIVVVARIHECC